MAAVRVSIRWFGIRRSLTAEQKAEAAEPFGAEAKFLSAGKKLLDNTAPAYKAVTTVRGKVISFWKSMSLPYPEPGIRLIRQDRIDGFTAQMREFQEELAEAVSNLDRHYSELTNAARQRLGSLYNPGDYPESLVGDVRHRVRFPQRRGAGSIFSNSTPSFTKRSAAACRQRFDEAVRLAEEAFAAELAKLVSHLTERLSGTNDGKPKTFRNSCVENLNEFFQRFRQLNVRSSEQLDSLVADAQRVIRGVDPQDFGTIPRCGSTSPRKCPASRACWTASWSIVRGRTSCVVPLTRAAMKIVIEPGGAVRAIYSEAIDLAALGSPVITRVSHVEPDQVGMW